MASGVRSGLAVRLAAALIAAAAIGAMGTATAEAQSSQRHMRNASPNSSYMAGPRTRVYITRRSWLDAGTEISRGDRTFRDHVFPPGYNLADQNSLRGGWRRQPLPDPFDLPGFYSGF